MKKLFSIVLLLSSAGVMASATGSNAMPLGGACVSNLDCESDLVCSATGTCGYATGYNPTTGTVPAATTRPANIGKLLAPGQACSANRQCGSGKCRNGKCAKYATGFKKTTGSNKIGRGGSGTRARHQGGLTPAGSVTGVNTSTTPGSNQMGRGGSGTQIGGLGYPCTFTTQCKGGLVCNQVAPGKGACGYATGLNNKGKFVGGVY